MRKILLIAFTGLLISSVQGQTFNPFATKFKAYVINAPEVILTDVDKIAVLNFSTLSSEFAKESGADLGTKLADYMMTDLFRESSGADDVSRVFVKGFRTNIFQLVERNKLNQVIAEQDLQNSGIVRDDQAVAIGKVLGIDAIITGSISYSSNDTHEKSSLVSNEYKSKRTVTCEARMKILSVKSGEILGTISEQATRVDEAKTNSAYPVYSSLQSPAAIAGDACKDLARVLVNYFCPHFVEVEYQMETIKVKEYRDRAKDANNYVERGEITSAYKLYKAIYDEDNYNPKVAYNLGVLYEVVGDFQHAYDCFSVAHQLNDKNDGYYEAYKRAESGSQLMEALAHLGIVIEPFEYKEGGETVLAKKLTTKGSRSKRVIAYAEPNSKSKVVGQIPGSTSLTILNQAGEWYQAQLLGNKTGYFHESDIRVE
ncbi:CsgG/HfaB family protein [uncultured Sunxiuqinia sp.]|uniref:CsgG/HfaB family protein n=1 Tax=uncultured Sunxiuqinia sp. TaxID=1573825 RepID=UPI002AA6B244|nr:CsgG/HfaB family protein [uncultured Sunxiuqinia sp.]